MTRLWMRLLGLTFSLLLFPKDMMGPQAGVNNHFMHNSTPMINMRLQWTLSPIYFCSLHVSCKVLNSYKLEPMDRQTDRRILPNVSSPCYTVENDGKFWSKTNFDSQGRCAETFCWIHTIKRCSYLWHLEISQQTYVRSQGLSTTSIIFSISLGQSMILYIKKRGEHSRKIHWC